MDATLGRVKILVCNVCNTDKAVRPYRHKEMYAYLCEDCADLTWNQVYKLKAKNQLLKKFKELPTSS